METKQKTVSLSKHLGITRKKLEKAGVFDSTLGIDTKLFVEPKLLVKSKVKEFKKSRIKILHYFAKLIKIHKHSATSQRLLEEAKEMLAVSEPIGLSIGYGNKTDRGTAISETLADKILLSLSEILSVGIDDEELVEILGLFVKGFGPDSMSDLTVSIIYEDFCLYTERIAKKLKVRTKPYTIKGKKYNLPQHPFKKTQIVFVPYELLSPLPIAVSWDEIAAASERSRRLRREFNELLIPVLEETLKDVKAKNPTEIKDFKVGINKLLDIYRSAPVKPYSLRADEKGYYGIRPFVELESAKIRPSSTPATFEELVVAVRDLIGQYRRSIEQNGGNKLLFRRSGRGKILKDNPHNEDVSQILFFMIADFYCMQANIVLSRETNAGLGPVDFSIATAYDKKVLVEIKKSTNHDLESGYKKQLEAYQKSENARYSFFVVITVKKPKRRGKDELTQLEVIQNIYEKNKKNGVPTPELIVIDGLIYPSPSKLRVKKQSRK